MMYNDCYFVSFASMWPLDVKLQLDFELRNVFKLDVGLPVKLFLSLSPRKKRKTGGKEEVETEMRMMRRSWSDLKSCPCSPVMMKRRKKKTKVG